MAAGTGKCCGIRHIVRLRQMLRRWRQKAALAARKSTGNGRSIPSDVPSGHVAISVGSSSRRFVVRTTYLNHPVFKKLLVQAEEEYGFTNQGPLAIPCDENLFEEIIQFLSRSDSAGNSARFVNLEDFQMSCGSRSNLDTWTDSWPLLYGVTDKPIW
ncbi:hypothetical protein NE237_023947 [Protea cynaroides]|uniref:Small auxin up regulated protein n=1 Tax=Protea cynaroides TaxID=273540 RepID=A0A9Q0K6V1_9MAGN|nr:hypothetical protein NE237_023947 [Protea cynaroides]